MSFAQSKNGLITTDFIAYGAEPASLNESAYPGGPPRNLYAALAVIATYEAISPIRTGRLIGELCGYDWNSQEGALL